MKVCSTVSFVYCFHTFYECGAKDDSIGFPIQATIGSTDENYLETKCIGLQGTHCVSGACKAIAVSIGNDTVFGRIASLTNKPDTRPTALQKDILRLVYIICSLAAFFMVIVAAVWGGYLRKQHPDYISVAGLIVSMVSVGIAFVPEGLPIAVTASMTVVANIMKRENVLCKSLKTVETLGSVNIICSGMAIFDHHYRPVLLTYPKTKPVL